MTMKKSGFFLFLVNIICVTCAKNLKVACPSYCTCEMYSNLRKAACVNRTIVVADLDLPSQTQILDVSFNQISQLKENVFLNNKLVHLKSLNISHNRIADINIFAFEGLGKLKILDLSYNALQQVFPRWFKALRRLENLILKGNHFRDISNLEKNAFNSNTLKVLDLSNSHIIHLRGDIFNLPHLVHLDLSENLLISLSQEVVNPFSSLRVLRVKGNLLSCNKQMKLLESVINSRNIQYDGDPCGKSERKFEKIVVFTTEKIDDEKNNWMIEEKDVLEYKPVQKIPQEDVQKVNCIVELSELPQVLLVFSALVLGILIGLLCGCSMKSCSMRYEFRRFNPSGAVRLKRINFLENEANLPLHESPLGYSTPILFRK